MGATTINITIPNRLKEEIDKRVKSGMYSSVSEFIRSAVRNMITSGVELPYGEGFSPEAESEILQAEAQGLKRKVSLESEKDIENLFKS